MAQYVITDVAFDQDGEVAYARLYRMETSAERLPLLGRAEVLSRREIARLIHAGEYVCVESRAEVDVPAPNRVVVTRDAAGRELLESRTGHGKSNVLHEASRLAMPDFEPSAADIERLHEIERGIAQVSTIGTEAMEKFRRNRLVEEIGSSIRLTDLGRWIIRGT